MINLGFGPVGGVSLYLNGVRQEEGKAFKSINSAADLFESEARVDSQYDAWKSSVPESQRLSKFDVMHRDEAFIDGRLLRLNENDEKGIEAISKATGFARATVQQFYALSLASGVMENMSDFVKGMIGEPNLVYDESKDRISPAEGARILSILA